MNRSTESCLKNLLMVYQYFIISDLFTLRWIVGSYFIWLNIVRFFTTHIIWAANYHYVPHKHLQNDNLLNSKCNQAIHRKVGRGMHFAVVQSALCYGSRVSS